MPAPDLSGYKVAALELSSSTKFNNLVQAVQDEFSDIDPDQIPGYPNDATKFLRGDGTWAAAGAPTMGTSLPGSPVDGQEFILVDSLTAPTYHWLFRYVSAKSSNKWVCLGGVPAYAVVGASESTTSATYTNLTTTGPSFTTPVAGDWDITVDHLSSDNTQNNERYMSFAVGGTGALDADAAIVQKGSTVASARRMSRKTAVPASTAIVAKYRVNNLDLAAYSDRRMWVMPVAVGG